jgi:hypothetical protein
VPEGQVEAIGFECFGKARLLLANPVGSGWFLLGEPIGVGLGKRSGVVTDGHGRRRQDVLARTIRSACAGECLIGTAAAECLAHSIALAALNAYRSGPPAQHRVQPTASRARSLVL